MEKPALFVEKSLKINMLKIKNLVKLVDHCHYTDEYRGAVHSICNLKYSIPKLWNYDYHFIIKKVAEELEGQFTCLGESIDKCITFPVRTEKS